MTGDIMKNWKLMTGVACLGLMASACATPTVVETRQASDRNLNCEELLAAIDETNDFEEEARDERGVTGTNVAAAVFFWPALVGTYMNTEDAIEAAEDRREYLNDLYEERNCQ
jgi:hypothetical protein